MSDHRLYCLDGEGDIAMADWIKADSDEEAIGKARAVRPDAHKCEIWLKSELIAKTNPSGCLERVQP